MNKNSGIRSASRLYKVKIIAIKKSVTIMLYFGIGISFKLGI